MQLTRACLIGLACVLGMTRHGTAQTGMPEFDHAGRLVWPSDYREWVFLSSGLDMSYSAAPAIATGHMFDNVFAPRDAYRVFLKTGAWPDKTVLVLENRGGVSKGSINTLGMFQTGEVMGVEAHVKDLVRFKGGWGFFAFDGDKPAEQIAYSAPCYACHQAHAAADTTFVQFYPTLLPVATRLGTLSAGYLAENTAGLANNGMPVAADHGVSR